MLHRYLALTAFAEEGPGSALALPQRLGIVAACSDASLQLFHLDTSTKRCDVWVACVACATCSMHPFDCNADHSYLCAGGNLQQHWRTMLRLCSAWRTLHCRCQTLPSSMGSMQQHAAAACAWCSVGPQMAAWRCGT